MNHEPGEPPSQRLPETGLLLVLQIVCASSAIASLPSGMIHPAWLAAFIAPAAVFLFLGSGWRARHVSTAWRFGAAMAIQAGAAYLVYQWVGKGLGEKESLACSLLPALTYFTLRREPSDTSLSLFLSFCFLLIGIMLSDERADWTLLVFLTCCAWAMQIEANNRSLLIRHSTRGPGPTLWTRVLRRSQVVFALMVAALLGYFTLDFIPSPGQRDDKGSSSSSSASNGKHSTGLPSRFDLSGTKNSPILISNERILRASNPNGAVAPDLYLRWKSYDRPGLLEWTTWPFSTATWTPRPSRRFSDALTMRKRLKRFDVHELKLVHLTDSPRGELFLPPGTSWLVGPEQIEFNHEVGHYKSTGRRETSYEVRYERYHKKPGRNGIDWDRTASRDATLPPALKDERILALAQQLAASTDRSKPSPMQLAKRIANGLQRRCSYELREPSGPYNDGIHNFLFGSRTGYCMYFATALAIMLRVHDVPCRIAGGLYGGDPFGDEREYGSRHAHAWVELPLKGLGWTVVDPTPPADRHRRGWPDPPATDEPDKQPNDTEDAAAPACFLADVMPFLEQPGEILSNPLSHPGAFLTLIGLFTLVSISMVVLLSRRRRRDQQRPGAPARPTPDSIRARRLLDRILKLLARSGYPKSHRSTLEQYVRALDKRADIDHSTLWRAFEAYQQVRFGAMRLSEERERRMQDGLASAEALSG